MLDECEVRSYTTNSLSPSRRPSNFVAIRCTHNFIGAPRPFVDLLKETVFPFFHEAQVLGTIMNG
jgi:hypothetical protein